MSDSLEEVAKVLEEALGMIRRVNGSVNDHRQSTAKIFKSLGDMLTLANNRIADATKRTALNEMLLNAVIEELVKAKVVSGESVASRFSLTVRKNDFLFDEASLAQAKLIASHLSSPGFPDDVPRPRGLGPVLIVDNDQPDS